MNENLNNDLNTTNVENQNENQNQNQNKEFYSGDVFNAYNPNQNTNNNTNPTPEKQFTDEPLSMLEWLLVIVVGCIPCVGLIMYLIWAFGKSGNIHRRNFSRAYLILMIIGYVLSFIAMFIISAASVFGYYYW